MNYFITQNWIEENTPIANSVDIKTVTPWIRVAAEQRIQPILGSYFYNDLLVKYNAQTLSADELTLLDLIQPSIAWRAAADTVFALSYQLVNKGLIQQNGDNIESSDLKEVQFGMSFYTQKAESYENSLIQYLGCDLPYRDLYPAFTSTNNTNSIIPPSSNNNTFNTIQFI